MSSAAFWAKLPREESAADCEVPLVATTLPTAAEESKGTPTKDEEPATEANIAPPASSSSSLTAGDTADDGKKDLLIEQLKRSLEVAKAHNNEFVKAIDDRDNTIAYLQGVIADKDDYIFELQDAYSYLIDDIEELRAQNKTPETECCAKDDDLETEIQTEVQEEDQEDKSSESSAKEMAPVPMLDLNEFPPLSATSETIKKREPVPPAPKVQLPRKMKKSPEIPNKFKAASKSGKMATILEE